MQSVEQMAISAGVITPAEIAKLRGDYPNVSLVEPPPRTGASIAWSVTIKPFTSEEESLYICEALYRNETLSIVAGALVLSHLQATRPVLHLAPISKQLVDLQQAFKVLILEFLDGRQPQAFVLNPEVSRQSFPNHPHLREDKVIQHQGRNLCAICYFFNPDFQAADKTVVRLNAFDFVSYFLAKHLIWCRTRFSVHAGRQLRMFDPGVLVLPEVGLGPDYSMQQIPCLRRPFIWGKIDNPVCGLWFGKEAPHTHKENLALRQDLLCHCGLNRKYADCHYKQDLAGQKLIDTRMNAFDALREMRLPYASHNCKN